MKNKFILCGVFGWCIEVIFTGIVSCIHHDYRFTSTTSILMFPIYGLAALLSPVYRLIKGCNFLIRGGIYTIFIYTAEYVTGYVLKRHNMCPWDYSKSKYNINGLIRLDYAPLWFLMGLFYEKVTRNS